MSALLFALALLAQNAAPETGPAAEGPPPEAAPAAEELPWPAGAPHDDYGLVAWCHGALTGYLDLHDQVMPEVTRIETTYRPPGRTKRPPRRGRIIARIGPAGWSPGRWRGDRAEPSRPSRQQTHG